jgi:hypothetical protein
MLQSNALRQPTNRGEEIQLRASTAAPTQPLAMLPRRQ